MKQLIGLIIATVGYFAAIRHLKQDILGYYDFVALAVVVGGTLAVAIMTVPKIKKRIIVKRIFHSFFIGKLNKKDLIDDCITFLSASDLDSSISKLKKKKSLPHSILIDGVELIQLGFGLNKINEILEQRVYQNRKTIIHTSNWMRSLAKYPPAFGLTGTVLGLIHLMRGVSDGIDPKETGIRMAIALVATFYGLILANLFINPFGEAISEEAKENTEFSEIVIKTVELKFKNANLLEAQEILNSFADKSERVNVIQMNDMQEAI